jgi:hypothetical protein
MTGGFFAPSYFPPGYFPRGYFGPESTLVVRLQGDAAAQYGPTIEAVELAEKVMDYWDRHPLK